MKKWLIVPLLLAAFLNYVVGDEPWIRDLSGIEQLHQDFKEDTGKVKIVALLSPT